MKNNKGFSLVELIIVIAIMAILVGVMAPQLIKYIEKSKISADTQLCDTIRTAITTAVMDPAVVSDTTITIPTSGTADSLASSTNKLGSAVYDILGTKTPKTQLKSTTAKSKDISYWIQNGNQITVAVAGTIGIGAGPDSTKIGSLK